MFRLHHFVNRPVHTQMTSLQEIFQWVSSYTKHGAFNINKKDAPKRLPWVHVAIANAKSLFRDMYHGIKEEFLQYYLDEFCYKFNRMYFGDRMFDRIVLAAASYRPSFKHRTYGSE